MSNKQYPKEKGWITATLQFVKGKSMDADEVLEFILMGKSRHSVQLGPITLLKTRAKVIFRESALAALDPDTAPIALDFDIHNPPPYAARCGKLVVKVLEIKEEFLPLPVIRVKILSGCHFNDRGNYGPGDEVTIGPLTDHWRMLTFEDHQPTATP